ncbi:Ti-type conjugative transfer relaxase TraA [Aureimonas ureilytica]|uniref:Ti-type conjugative transfer relaxase TraA n=1 Tax=Aureimonas ureilytica TaxID=401562 RepID=UPI0007342956|nr:Ti-type conjugative transfer relaxase TraA [Aureimonas ureilytica]
MAIYHFRQTVISGGSGHSAVAAAAYRHNVAMYSQHFGETQDYSRRQGTVHSELAIPADAPEWVRNQLGFAAGSDAPGQDGSRLVGPDAINASQELWNKVERGEKRYDAKYATELTLALPVELTQDQQIALVRAFVEEHLTARGRVADWAIHVPPGREHNPHVHILSTVRPLTEQGFGPKAVIARDEEGEPLRTQRGAVVYEKWSGSKDELYEMRAAWGSEMNQALALAGHDITVDHRSFEDRGITDILPTQHRGKTEHMRQFGPEHQVPARDAADRAATFARFEENPSLALEHITREQSTFSTRDIARVVHRYMGEGHDFQGLMNRIGMLPELVTIQAQIHDPETNRVVQGERFTTEAVLEREAAMLRATLNRHADRGFEVDQVTREAALSRAQERQGFTYTPEQKAAVDRLTRDEGIGVMVGIAGAGKSTVMAAVNEIYSAAGAGVYGAALAGKAADNLQQSSGIESRTLASWENAWAGGYDQLLRGDVFVIDEAGMVASAQMARVMAQLDGFGAKVLLVGDARQLQPIEAGAAFRSIASEVGYVELTEVRRQEREDHARASVLFGAGEARSAMDIYKGNDTFQFHDARAGALEAAIKGWDHDRRAGADVVILAHTNRDVLDLNAMARASIKLDGGLTGGETFATARGPREFAPGDRVLFLENDRTLGVRNGSIGHVESVGSKGLVVSLPDRAEPVAITREGYNNIDHGYAMTIHKSQGSTYDRVHVVAGAMMDAQLSYVSLSRHREDVTFHIPLDVFTRPGAEQLATPDQAMNRLSRETLKDTSIDFRKTPDYAEARQALDARIALAASPAGRFETFLEQRGLPHPSEVLEQVKAYAASFLAQNGPQDAAQQIHVDTPARYRDATQAASLEPHDDLRQPLNRLQHVQDHSASMNHEGSARRSAFHTAENELTRYVTSQGLHDYAERVADVIAPSLVVAIGPNLADPDHEPRLAGLSQTVRDALGANWRDVHTVSRATWELGLLETVRDVDTTYRQQREEQRVLADYQRMVSPLPLEPHQSADPERSLPLPILPLSPPAAAWSQGVDEAVASTSPAAMQEPLDCMPRFEPSRFELSWLSGQRGPEEGQGLPSFLPLSFAESPSFPAMPAFSASLSSLGNPASTPLLEALACWARLHDVMRPALERGLEPLASDARALAEAGAALDGLQPGAHDQLRSALHHDSATRSALQDLRGSSRAEALSAGIIRESAARLDPRIQADRFLLTWNEVNNREASVTPGWRGDDARQALLTERIDLARTIEPGSVLEQGLRERWGELGLMSEVQADKSVAQTLESQYEKSREIELGWEL